MPAGFSPPSKDAPIGVPIGMEMLGMPWMEGPLLNLARMVSEVRRVRKMPVFADGMVEASGQGVPVVVPDRGNIPKVYPIGVR